MAKDAASAALLKPKAERGRNQFPLDQKHVYSIKAGQISPVKAFHFMPGDFYKIQAHDFSITFPMNTAAFLRGRKETCFYSVYNSAIWSLFNQYMATRQDPKTSAFGSAPKLVEPRIRMFDLYGACLNQFARYCARKYLAPVWLRANPNAFAFLQDLDTRLEGFEKVYFNKGFAFNDNDTQRNMWNLSYDIEGISFGYDFSQDSSFSLYSQLSFNISQDADTVSNRDYELDIVGHERVYSWIRKLDMLGFGNLYPMFSQRERQFASVLGDSSNYDSALVEFKSGIGNLADALIRMTWSNRSGDVSTWIPLYTNVYAICAYNSIFYHFFRNSYYDLGYLVNDYSLDFVSAKYSERSEFNVLYLSDFSFRFLDIEYHQWKKDLFTSLLPDTQFGAVSSIDLGASLTGYTDPAQFDHTPSMVSNTRNGYIQELAVSKSSSNNGYLTPNLPIGGPDTVRIENPHTHVVNLGAGQNISFDVIQLKRAEMIQQYRQTLMRAGNKTSDVFRAIYGGAPSSEHEDDIIPRFLETFGEDIFVDPVISTASTGNTENGALGDIAARGKFRGDSTSFKFNAGKNFGVILCLTYVVPEAEYNSIMIDKHNLELSPEQHFLPAYENWGLEPVYSDELNFMCDRDKIKTLGFAPRYYHKKQSLDLVHGAFCSIVDYQRLTGQEVALLNKPSYYGEFNHWVSPRSEFQSRGVTLLRDFYINPSVLDNVFVRSVSADQGDDQFICNTYFEIQSTKEASKVGLINFV